MWQPPRVSVITATYNWSSVLRYAIESVLGQTLADFEMLVIGDGCTDDSAEVVTSFNDPRLRWHNLPENTGHQSAPNNAGLAMARGEFIAYLGHDDLWYPTHLAEMVNMLESSGADVAYSWLEMIWPPRTGLRLITGITPNGQFQPDLIIPPSSVMHRRDVWRETGDWKDYRTITTSPGDEFLARAFERGKKFTEVKSLSVFKFNAEARPNCYVEKPCHEQARYIQRMKEDPGFIARELAAVVESNMRRHPEDVSRSVVQPGIGPGVGLNFIARELAAVVESNMRRHPEDVSRSIVRPGIGPGVGLKQSRIIRGLEVPEIPEPQFPPAPVNRLAFASAAAEPFLWYGWSFAESESRWSDGDKAALTFSLAKPIAMNATVELTPLVESGRINAQRIEIFLNDIFIASFEFTDSVEQICQFALPVAAVRKRNVLTFNLPDAISPVWVGINTDVRRLAIRVNWIDFAAA
jgi:glycosyltransferase involved in cell wall biosynthesis